ncbi:Uncharacterised protein [uncultured archaeon]|nr:Uncharacterised protein [uncultured archaeon]
MTALDIRIGYNLILMARHKHIWAFFHFLQAPGCRGRLFQDVVNILLGGPNGC